MAVIVLFDEGVGAGTDYIPSALDWGNISQTGTSGVETNAASQQTLAGIDMAITIRCEWTSTSSTPSLGYWVKNGVAAAPPGVTSVDVTGINGDVLYWSTYAANSHPDGNTDGGTCTITNQTHKSTITMTIASPAVVSWTGHGFAANAKIRFSTTGALPTGVTAGTIYYVIATGLGADEFQFSETQGGSAVNSSGTQSGTHTCVSVLDTFTYACRYVNTGGGQGEYAEPPEVPGWQWAPV